MLLKLPTLASRGLNSDLDPWDLPPELISHGVNFRIDAGSVMSYGGYHVFSNPQDDFRPGYSILARTRNGPFQVIPGRTKIYAFIGGEYTDISNNTAVNADEEFNWSACLNGGVVVINSSSKWPVYWWGTGVVEPLPWDFASGETWESIGNTCDVMRQHKNYLIALNLHEDIDKPDSFRWSTPADENGIPFTWDEQNTSGLAGIQSLGGDGGGIIDGLSMRDSFVIYSRDTINVIDLSGDEFIWRRRELSSTYGLLAKDCVVEVKGRHYLLAQGDIVVNDGNSLFSIAHDKILHRINTRINTEFADRSFAFRHDANKEIWFCVPEDDNSVPNIAYVYQWRDEVWSIRELPDNTAFIVASPTATVAEEWDDAVTEWDQRQDSWSDGSSVVSFAEYPYAVNNVSAITHLLDGEDIDEDLNTQILRTDLAIVDQVATTTITRLYPHIQGTNPVRIQIGSQDYSGSPVRWKPYELFDPKTQRKLDVRTTGALHAYQISSEGKGQFRMSGMTIEYEVDGIR